MSSDVYIDVADGTDRGVTFRVGHVAMMSYFEHNLVGALTLLQLARPRIDVSFVDVTTSLFQAMQDWWKEACELDEAYFRALYGHALPREVDIATSFEVFSFLSQHYGKTWSLRID